jgi:hypothetical protein
MPKAFDREYTFTIDALIAKYELEPDLRDIFVEGVSDVTIFNNYAEKQRISSVLVYPIVEVNVPKELVEQQYGTGNRGRICALARELSENVPNDNDNVYCVADQDFEPADGPIRNFQRLLLSDFSCIEAYGFSWDVISKLHNTYFGVHLSEEAFSAILSICQRAFFIRDFKQKNAVQLNWVGLSNSLSHSTHCIPQFNLAGFLGRQFGSKGLPNLKAPANAHVADAEEKVFGDIRSRIHKDDFFEVVCWHAEKLGSLRVICNAQVFGRVLLTHLGPEHLSQFKLFERVKSWAGKDEGD